jgi:hypothetical protein
MFSTTPRRLRCSCCAWAGLQAPDAGLLALLEKTVPQISRSRSCGATPPRRASCSSSHRNVYRSFTYHRNRGMPRFGSRDRPYDCCLADRCLRQIASSSNQRTQAVSAFTCRLPCLADLALQLIELLRHHPAWQAGGRRGDQAQRARLSCPHADRHEVGALWIVQRRGRDLKTSVNRL